MKITRQKLRTLIREFLASDRGFNIDLGGEPPAASPSRGGGGSNKLHQLIRIDSQKSYYDPKNYIAIHVKTSTGSLYSNMAEEYGVLDADTKDSLYDIMPPNLKDHPEGGILMQIKEGYRKLTNGFIDDLMKADVPVGRSSSYEYFTVYHPHYVNNPGEAAKKLELYQKVTGYSVDNTLLNDYETVMHAASNLHG